MRDSEMGEGSNSREKLGDAKGEQETQERCKAILEIIAPGQVRYWLSGGDYYIELPRGGGALWVYLRRWRHGSIAVCVYPGNNMSQAQAFFKKAVKEDFLGLASKGWKIQPCLSLNYMSRFLPMQGNLLSSEEYFDYWWSEDIRQVRRENNSFEAFSQELRARRFIDANDQRAIKKEFINVKKRAFINICPGFELVYGWRRADANRLDREEQFVDAVRYRANEALGTWGQSL